MLYLASPTIISLLPLHLSGRQWLVSLHPRFFPSLAPWDWPQDCGLISPFFQP